MPLTAGKRKANPGFKPRTFRSLPPGYEYLHQLPARAGAVIAGGQPVKLYKANVLKDALVGKIPGAIRVVPPTGRPRWAAPKKSGDQLISTIAKRQQELADAAARGWERRAALTKRLGITIKNLNRAGELPYKIFGDEAHIAPEDVAKLEAEAARLPQTVSLKYLAGISGFGRKRITNRVTDGVIRATTVFGEPRISIPDSIESVQKRLEKLKATVQRAGALAYRDDRSEIVFLESLLTRFKQLQERVRSGAPHVGGQGKVLLSKSGAPLTKGTRSALFNLRRAETEQTLRKARRSITRAEQSAVQRAREERAEAKEIRAAERELERARSRLARRKQKQAADVPKISIPAAKAEMAEIAAELERIGSNLEAKQVEHAELGRRFRSQMDENGYWTENDIPKHVQSLVLQRNSIAGELQELESRADALKERRRAIKLLLANNGSSNRAYNSR